MSRMRRMHPVIEEVLKSYGDKVRFVVRDFPQPSRARPQSCGSRKRRARARKVFEYAALLFKRQQALDVASLKKYASELQDWTALVSTRRSIAALTLPVKRDIQDGEMGVGVTPHFCERCTTENPQAEGLREAIDRAATTPK